MGTETDTCRPLWRLLRHLEIVRATVVFADRPGEREMTSVIVQ